MNRRALHGRVVELLRVVDPSSRDVSSPPDILELDGVLLVGLRETKEINLKNSTAASPCRNHEPLTQDETHILLAAVFSLRVTAQQET